ncbi:MAG: glycosyltransferase [Tumebacillaceae bacterium]
MKPLSTVLILFARYGEGHIQVAEALKQAFERRGAVRVVLLDLFQESHPVVNAVSKSMYRKSFTWLSGIYGWSYDRTKEMSHDRLSSRLFNSFGMHTLNEAIRTLQPDVVINTFPMLAMPEWRRQTGQRIPTFAVLTDFVLHNRWIHPEIDKYYVATDDLADQLVRKGIRQDQIVVSGIPIRSAFQIAGDVRQERQRLAEKYQLSPSKQKVLLMAGGYGISSNWPEIIQQFHHNDWEVVVVCGKNESARAELLQQTAHLSGVHIFGYVKQIEELMKTADLLVTKAGGITLAEAMSLNLPLLLLSPVPGQEMENAQYLEAKGVARIINSRQQIREINALLDSLNTTEHALGRQDSAERVVRDIQNTWQEVTTRRGTRELATLSSFHTAHVAADLPD